MFVDAFINVIRGNGVTHEYAFIYLLSFSLANESLYSGAAIIIGENEAGGGTC